jgi:pyruvate/oxaloacetate carboxyltransferase
LSTASIVKAVEAGIDRVDTAIGSMSMTVHFIKGILLAQLAFHIGQHTARHL